MNKTTKNTDFVIKDNFLIRYNGKDDEELVNIEIPYGVKIIASKAFENCKHIESVVIPETVEEIYSYAFYHCTNLKHVEWSDNLVRIGLAAFEACSLDSVNLKSVKGIDKLAFFGNHNIKELEIPATVNCIGEDAFSVCPRLKKIIIKCSKNVFINFNNTFKKAVPWASKATITFVEPK